MRPNRSWNTINEGYSTFEARMTYFSPFQDYLQFEGSVLSSISGSSGEGVDIPNFHKRMKEGELLPQTYYKKFVVSGSASCDNYFEESSTTRAYRVGNHPLNDHWCLTEADVSNVLGSTEHSYLAQQAAARIATSGFDALTFIAEFAEIPKMFFNIGHRLLKAKWPKSSKDFSNDWLEYRYGWRPLLGDIKSLNQAIKNLNEKTARTRYSERVQRKLDSGSSTSDEITIAKSYKEIREVITDSWTISGSGSVVADITIPELQFNPVLTLWEIIPFSFVIDWFVGVGQSLSALTFLTLNTNYSASSGFRVDMRRDWTTYVVYYPDTGLFGQYDSTGSSEASLIRRHPCPINIKPQFKLNIDFLKILDLLGLIIQRKRG